MSKTRRNTVTNVRFWANKWIDTRTDLSASENAVMRQLIRQMNMTYECHPSERYMCKVTGIGSRNTISTATKKLQQLGLISMVKKISKNAQYPCKHYVLHVPAEYITNEQGLTEEDNPDITVPMPKLDIKDWGE